MNDSTRPISALRQRMVEDMRMRKLAPKTQAAYVRSVRQLAAYLRRSPDIATAEDLRNYQLYLVDHGTSPISLNASITGLKFFFDVTLDRQELMAKMQPVHVPRTLPVVLSREEAARLIAAVRHLKHQTALSVAYGGGLRVSEVVALKVGDVDGKRMTLRIEQGKGAKDRYVMLSPVLLERLRTWWRVARAQGKMLDGGWLFPGLNPIESLSTAAQPRCARRRHRRSHRQTCLDAHASTFICHSPARTEGRHPGDPGAARTQEARDHRALRPGSDRDPAPGRKPPAGGSALIGQIRATSRPGGCGDLPRPRAGMAPRSASSPELGAAEGHVRH